MLSTEQIQAYYLDHPFRLPDFWTLGREHPRVTLHDGRFVKLNHLHGYPEPLESSVSNMSANGAMKSCAKNMVRAAM